MTPFVMPKLYFIYITPNLIMQNRKCIQNVKKCSYLGKEFGPTNKLALHPNAAMI